MPANPSLSPKQRHVSGARVGVIGSLQVDEWIDKETGEPRSKPKVIVRECDILESKAEADLQRSNK